jgi:hypothetical protein
LLIHPAREDPEQLIGFRDEYAYALDGDRRAEVTINEVLELNREPLAERRRERLKLIRHMQVIAGHPDLGPTMHADANAWLARSVADDAEYAAMTRAALRAPT